VSTGSHCPQASSTLTCTKLTRQINVGGGTLSSLLSLQRFDVGNPVTSQGGYGVCRRSCWCRETAKRMEAYAGEVTAMHPSYAHDNSARALNMSLATTQASAGPCHITPGSQYVQRKQSSRRRVDSNGGKQYHMSIPRCKRYKRTNKTVRRGLSNKRHT